MSVEAVSAGSRIVPRLVDALEADRRDLLPAPVYVRGFIRAYCEQVGVDAEAALRLYEEQVGPPPPLTVKPPTPPPLPARSPRRWGRSTAALLLVALCTGGILMFGHRQPDAGASRRTGVAVTASPAPAGTGPSVSTATASTSGPLALAERVLMMRAIEATWVRVLPDGGEPTEETLAPGAVREWHSTGRFRVTLGNAGGVELKLDGQELPALGERGRVVRDVTVPSEAGS